MPEKKPFVVKKTVGRDIAIGVVAGALVLGFVLWGILHMSQEVSGHMLTGQIVGKHFQPRPEEQLSIGQAGLQEREVAGEYTFQVLVPGDKSYTVWVEKPVFDSHNVGDKLSFLPPPPKPGQTP